MTHYPTTYRPRTRPEVGSRAAATGFIASLLLALPALAGAAVQTQTLTLQPGWNAVWIDPSPLDPASGGAAAPGDVFADDRVTVVARPLLPAGSAQFVTDSAKVFNDEEWLVWYRDPQSLVSTLQAVDGSQGYYVFVDGAAGGVTAEVTGEVRFSVPDWVPASYNLVGFNLSAPVTFGEFFGAEGEADGNHPVSAILRLQGGTWAGVTSSDLMQPGEAYWVKSVRNSDFAGPVAVAFDGAAFGGIDLGEGPGDVVVEVETPSPFALSSAEITFTNVDTTSHEVAVSLVAPDPADELVVYEVVPGADALTHDLGPAGQVGAWPLGPLAANATRTVTIGGRRDWTAGDPHRENLYRIDVGSQFFWLPVAATNNEVSATVGAASASSVGLWVGEITFDRVSRFGDAGLEPAKSTAPARIILHVDASGNTSLLGHVMFMRTKSADEGVPTDPVLVVDEAKIPYFQGIESRGGKRVGRRIESVAFDLPRDDSPGAQAALVDRVAAATGNPDPGTVNGDDIALFLAAQTSRPPELAETYHLSWPLLGGLAGGGAVQTAADQPLALDPFHRSNPFRHAFHPQHGAGFAITRSFTIRIDSEALAPGVLSGLYEETVEGLASQPVTARGSISLTRLSTVAALQ